MKRVYSQTFGVVAALLEKEGKFLLVKEHQIFEETKKFGPDHEKWNHPAGWIEVGENPIEAIQREVKEETGYDFTPTAILGLYSIVRNDIEKELGDTPHALKIVFVGTLSEHQGHLHHDVSETRWFSAEEIEHMDQKTLRDHDIKIMVRDYQQGKRFPLELLTHTHSR